MVGFDNKMTLHTPPTETQCQQYLSCNWPDFDETLNEGSCEHVEQFNPILNQILNPILNPNIKPIIEPNIDMNIEPNIESNIKPKIEPKK